MAGGGEGISGDFFAKGLPGKYGFDGEVNAPCGVGIGGQGTVAGLPKICVGNGKG